MRRLCFITYILWGFSERRRQHTEEGVVHRLRELDGWVEHMKEWGFTAVYMGPLFESVSHGYDTTDYRKVDSRLGDEEDFRHFVELCHRNGTAWWLTECSIIREESFLPFRICRKTGKIHHTAGGIRM